MKKDLLKDVYLHGKTHADMSMFFGLSFVDSDGCRYFRPYSDYITAYDAAGNAASAGMHDIIIYDYDSENNTYIEFVQY